MPSDKASSYLSRLGPGARVFRVARQPHVWSEPPSGSKMDSLLSPDPKSPSADSVPRNHSASSSSTGNEFVEGGATPASSLGSLVNPPSRTTTAVPHSEGVAATVAAPLENSVLPEGNPRAYVRTSSSDSTIDPGRNIAELRPNVPPTHGSQPSVPNIGTGQNSFSSLPVPHAAVFQDTVDPHGLRPIIQHLAGLRPNVQVTGIRPNVQQVTGIRPNFPFSAPDQNFSFPAAATPQTGFQAPSSDAHPSLASPQGRDWNQAILGHLASSVPVRWFRVVTHSIH